MRSNVFHRQNRVFLDLQVLNSYLHRIFMNTLIRSAVKCRFNASSMNAKKYIKLIVSSDQAALWFCIRWNHPITPETSPWPTQINEQKSYGCWCNQTKLIIHWQLVFIVRQPQRCRQLKWSPRHMLLYEEQTSRYRLHVSVPLNLRRDKSQWDVLTCLGSSITVAVQLPTVLRFNENCVLSQPALILERHLMKAAR